MAALIFSELSGESLGYLQGKLLVSLSLTPYALSRSALGSPTSFKRACELFPTVN